MIELIRFLLTVFGLSRTHKKLDQCLAGLFISAISLFTIMNCLSIDLFEENTLSIVSKVLMILFGISTLLAYILLNQRIDKYYGMYEEIDFYHQKITRNEKNNNISLIYFSIYFILSYIFSLALNYSEEYYNIFDKYIVYVKVYYYASCYLIFL